jgi:hypothetical protein
MITKMKKDDVIAIGARNRASYLLQQHGYTMGIARAESEELIPHLTPTYLDEVDDCAESLREAHKNKVLAAEDAKGSTQHVNEIMRRAKVWRTAVVKRAKKARYMGCEVPDTLLRLDGAASVPAVAEQIDAMVKLLENATAEDLPGVPLAPVIREGRTLVDRIRELDQVQEVKRIDTLPSTVRDFYYRKGLLYLGLKAVNEAGRELYAADKARAARYDLAILYRNMGRKRNDSSISSAAGGKG